MKLVADAVLADAVVADTVVGDAVGVDEGARGYGSGDTASGATGCRETGAWMRVEGTGVVDADRGDRGTVGATAVVTAIVHGDGGDGRADDDRRDCNRGRGHRDGCRDVDLATTIVVTAIVVTAVRRRSW